MEPVWSLAFLSLAMFIGCYLAGSIPLVLTLSEVVMRRVTTFGAGLLVGTALTVIIPEGVESLFEAWHTNQQSAVEGGQEGGAPAAQPAIPANADPPPARHQAVISEVADKDGGLPAAALAAVKAHLIEDNVPAYTEERLFFIMGVALLVGFIFMLLVDQMAASSHSHRLAIDSDVRPKKNLTATIGLVVHAAADGLALGAAAGLSKTDVEMVIFIAIMLHKAPAAFGFTSFLLHEGFDKRTAKVHLLVFALAAPLAAFIAYFGLVKIVTVIQAPLTGIAMLFSAGTFLYVATVHVLSELTNSRSGEEYSSKLSKIELILVVSGALLPLLFNVFHSH